MRDLRSGYSTFEMIIVLGIGLTLMAFVIPLFYLLIAFFIKAFKISDIKLKY